jgi:4-amino-4-deoxy-L-arabinose transferase-like glycosyltransferase
VNRHRTILAAIFLFGIAFRIAVIASWHVPAGDGIHYYQLSQELVNHHRFALAPPPALPTFARMPGYPLFLALFESRADLEHHLRRAVAANLILDLLTAWIVYLILTRFRLGERAALIGVGLVLFTPLMVLLACYGLSETMATCVCTLTLGFALRAMNHPQLKWYALVGLFAGLALLIRADAVTLAPPIAVAYLLIDAPLRERIKAAAISAAIALVVFAPWPIRNQLQFGNSHPQATLWRTMDGRPLPNTMVDWERTWASSAPGESYLDVAGALDQNLDPNRKGIVMPQMYDDDAERQKIAALFDRYNHERWTPAVTSGFTELANEHRARHPFRFWIVLPILRIYHLYSPVPEWELPMRVKWLGLPANRWIFGWIHPLLYLFAIAGAVILWRRGDRQRKLAAVLLTWLFARMMLFAFAIPVGTTQRYLIEALPALLVLSAIGIDQLLQWPRQKRTRPTSA